MKIYEIGTGYTPIPAQMGAATEIVVEELAKAFAKQGISVEIIDIASSSRTPTQLPIREVSVPKVFTATDVQLGLMHKVKRVIYSVCLARELKKLLKTCDDKPVLHFHNQYNLFFFLKLVPRCLQKKCLIAYTNHSGIWRMDWKEIKRVIRRRYFQEAICMQRADVVFVLNEETKCNIMERLAIENEKISVVDNGVNTDIYCPLPDHKKRAIKEKLGLTGKSVYIQVGSVTENKGQMRSIKRLIPILTQNPQLVFAYAGAIVDREYYNQINLLTKNAGVEAQVCYLGMIEPGNKLNEVYNIADAVLCSSKYEGFSLVIVEALSAGIPVLMNKVCPCFVGDGCIRYDEDEFLQLIEEIILSRGSAYEGICLRARNNVMQNYSWEKIAADYLRIIAQRLTK